MNTPLDSGLRRNDEVSVVTSVVISSFSQQAGMMEQTGMLIKIQSRRNDEVSVVTSVVISAFPQQADMMEQTGMLIKIYSRRDLSLAPSSFRRRPESSGLDHPFPRERE